MLSKCADQELFRELRRTGSPEVREHAVRRYLPLAYHEARRFGGGNDSFDDRFQIASFALLKAIDRFDPDRGVRFSSYAVPTIRGELKRYARDHAWQVRVPRSLKERALEVERVIAKLTARYGRSPSTASIAEAMGLTSAEVLEAIDAAHTLVLDSLDDPVSTEDGATRRGDRVGTTEGGYEHVEARSVVAAGVRALPERERRIIELRFGAGLSQSEIGRVIGVSQMQVSRLLRRTLDSLAPVT